ncbi:MAG: hypothetical protein R3C61_24865 [Bacteroidia bacterium]
MSARPKNELKTAHRQQVRQLLMVKMILMGATFTSMALAVMLMYQDLSHYRLSPPKLSVVAETQARAYQPRRITYQFSQMSGRPDILFDMHHSLPVGSGVVFVPGSLRVENGYFSEASVNNYGGTGFLRISHITGDAGELELSIAVSSEGNDLSASEFSDGAFIRFNGSNYFADRAIATP